MIFYDKFLKDVLLYYNGSIVHFKLINEFTFFIHIIESFNKLHVNKLLISLNTQNTTDLTQNILKTTL